MVAKAAPRTLREYPLPFGQLLFAFLDVSASLELLYRGEYDYRYQTINLTCIVFGHED